MSKPDAYRTPTADRLQRLIQVYKHRYGCNDREAVQHIVSKLETWAHEVEAQPVPTRDQSVTRATD